MGGRTALGAGLVTCLALAFVPGAQAVSTCKYDSSQKAVLMSTTSAPTQLAVRREPSGNAIQWRGGNGAYINCGVATVLNTDTINYGDLSVGQTSTTFTIDLSEGAFAPGATGEGMFGSPEIEFNMGFGGGPDDVLAIAGGGPALHVRLGADGVNLNSNETLGVDRDVSSFPVPHALLVVGGAAADEVNASGGAGTGAPATLPLRVDAGAGADTVTGGSAADRIDVVDAAATDTVGCGAGADVVAADPGDAVAADCEQVDTGATPGGPGGPGGGPGVPGADTTPPVFVSASMLRKKFAVGPRATAVSARAKRGTAFRWSLSEAATVTIAITRRAPGVRKGKRCVKPRRGLRGKKCARIIPSRLLTRHSDAGATTMPFSGRIGRRALKPGRYTTMLVAQDAAGNTSNAKRLNFRVVRR